MHENKNLYESADAVEYFAREEALQPPEAVVLAQLQPWLATASMLDLGVGAGRTTAHFAPAVRQYVGADYAAPMIDVARQRFGDRYRFEVADVRALPFETAAFDFVLFSFNGLDSIATEERLRGLEEIRRVLCTGGRFLFSTHNLAALPEIFGHDDERAAALRRHNPPLEEMLACEATFLHERVFDGVPMLTYYIRPEVQLAQLANACFTDVEIYGLDGRRVAAGEQPIDRWLYFLATAA